SLPDFQALSWSDPCGETQVGPTCWESHRDASSWADLSFITVEPERYLLGTLLGELWVMYADVGADVGGKFRLTPSTSASINADSFLHVTWQVDAFTTARRYPQVFISDQTAPIQWKLPDGNTLVFQTFIDSGTANWPNSFTMQICDHRGWEVNNQCPRYDLYRIDGLSPNAEAAEHTGVDHAARFDVYVSSARAYLLLDGEPHGCIDLPSAGVPSGSVSVTFGDVLYHSGVDSVFDFHQRHQQIVAKRHFDNLGYKSGVGAPAWDEERFPCATGDPMP
ncbi:MAG TPA: hypothetical protein VGP93_14695, partial [Polyangiaceae bacterium]|nr:hypothetical protein [Polyangiaceae bacterium]